MRVKSASIFQKPLTVFIHDLIMVPIAWLGAYWLRFNFEGIPERFWDQAVMMLPVLLIVQGSMFWYFGLYRGVWRFASLPDLVRIFKAVFTSLLVAAVAVFFLTRLEGVPRSVFALDGILLILLLGGPRFIYRWSKDKRLYTSEVKNVLIVGAGRAGEMLVRDLRRTTQDIYSPVGFVDDDDAKQGKEIHGIRVLGSTDQIPVLSQKLNIHLIIIALPSATSRQIQKIVRFCEESSVTFRILPRLHDLVSGRVLLKDLREVSIDDLLGREQVSLDWSAISEELTGKIVLVSGGGGSIGAELCRQIARMGPKQLIILEQSEFNLYSIELELKKSFPEIIHYPVLANVADAVAMDELFMKYHPELVFHAAAYKHVPLLEGQVRTAVHNNVIGTRILATISDKFNVEAFVMVSTDKAVNPTNLMGATKRAAEIYCQELSSRSNTRFITVRFGNVLDSAGSVIPLFRKQISLGGPVTVTHPDITRYFMTIPEATQLILQASVLGKGSEIFVLDMGEPIKITYLAEQMILLSGKTPGEDIEIVFSGLRPGEKLYEELFHESEKLSDTRHPKIFLAASRKNIGKVIEQQFDKLQDACEQNDVDEIKRLVRELVPEYQENAHEN